MAPSSTSGRPGQEAGRHRLPRAYRLKQQRLIRPLFDRRRDDVRTVASGCIRLLYRIVPRSATGKDAPALVGFAPGRHSTSVARNRVRRLLREVYRVNQHVLIDLFSGRSDAPTLMILFRGRLPDAASCIPRDLPRALARAAAQIENHRAEAAQEGR